MEIEDKVNSPPRPPHPPPPPPPPPPPSEITSPSHDFSFTVSFQTLSSPATLRGIAAKSPSASSGAFDLPPADDIFLHGHLLPLHLLSHPGSPPRDSDISLENFRFPLGHTDSDRNFNYFDPGKAGAKEESRATKPPSALAAFFGLGKLRRRNEKEGAEAAATTTTKRKRKGINVIRLLRKYANLVELLFFFRTGERERELRRHEDDLRRRPCSFSGHSNRNSKAEAAAQGEWRRRKKGQMSAPASMRTSPSNSGLLSASSMTISSTSTSDSSTMEELQSAIQAAIAHCKNSIAVAAKQRAGET